METVRFAARNLRRSPLFSLATILILAVGIGANTAMFSVVSGVLLRPLPFADPQRLVLVRETRSDGDADTRASLATFLAWQRGQQAVALAAYTPTSFNLTGGEPMVAQGGAVSAGFFSLLGEPVLHGRNFTAEDDHPSAARTLILSHALWQSRFGGDPGLIGRSLRIEGQPYTVIGVARPGFDFPEGAQLWTPIQPYMGEEHLNIVEAKFADVVGRLEPGVPVERARAQLSAITGTLPGNQGWSARVTGLHESMTGSVKAPLLILMSAVLLVLLIACLNVGNLLLARSVARQQEVAIRSALGASRMHITRERIAEGLLLSLCAGALGILGALWSLDLIAGIAAAQLPRLAQLSIDGRVLAFTLALSLLTGLLASVVPLLRSPVRDLTPALKASGRQNSAAPDSARVRGVLVVGEVALSVVLLIGAGLLLRSFLAIMAVDPGFQPERVSTFDITLPHYKYSTLEHRAFARQLVARTELLPGVNSAAIVHNLPVSGRRMVGPVVVENRPRQPGQPPAHVGFVSPGYFRTMGIRLLRGRDFEAADGERGWVAIVNESFARAYFPGEDALGKKARTLFGPPVMKEIVGVVADVHQTDLRQAPEPVFYTLAEQDISSSFTLVARSSLPSATINAAVRAVVRDLDADLPLGTVSTMENLIAQSVAGPRFYATLLSSFALLAALLAMLGLYAVLAQSVAQRRQEIGVRMALGARTADIQRLVLSQGLRFTLIGAVLGLAGAAAVSRVLRKLLFGVQPTDTTTFVAVAGVLILIALMAMAAPARNAARTNPLDSFRS